MEVVHRVSTSILWIVLVKQEKRTFIVIIGVDETIQRYIDMLKSGGHPVDQEFPEKSILNLMVWLIACLEKA